MLSTYLQKILYQSKFLKQPILLLFIGMLFWAAAGVAAETTSDVVPGQVVIKFRNPVNAAKPNFIGELFGHSSLTTLFEAIAELDIHKVFPETQMGINSSINLDGVVLVKYSSTVDPTELATQLESLADVEFAEPVYIRRNLAVPDDPLYAQQWYLKAIGAPGAWDVQTGDPSVIVAILDSGVDTDHPDLAENLWINSDELADNAIDDDDNGYVDDWFGWDFEQNNNDPNPDPDGRDDDNDGIADGGIHHGTRVAGLAAAVGNNGEGVAGTAWQCKIMALKVMDDEGLGNSVDISEAIKYAADNGARIINLSIGSTSPSILEENAVAYAFSKGCVIVAAAGNDHVSEKVYPAALSKVVAVAGTANDQDDLSLVSNYGTWVDVLAPGGDFEISPPWQLMTPLFYDPLAGFTRYYGSSSFPGYLDAGTSFSAPLVSGVAALLISKNPTWSNQQVIRQLLATADNVDTINPGFENQLGYGRVNAARAMTEAEQTSAPLRIVLSDIKPTDVGSGNGDGWFEHGETVSVSVAIENLSFEDAQGLSLTLTTEDSDVTIVNDFLAIADVPAKTLRHLPPQLSFRVSETAPAHPTQFALTVAGQGGYRQTSLFKVTLGIPAILLVDDDDAMNNLEGFYTTVFDTLGIAYGIWDHNTRGTPTFQYMGSFEGVLWYCEGDRNTDFATLNFSDRNSLSLYLNNGNTLILCGQDIGWDLNDQASSNASFVAQSFFSSFLHATYLGDVSASKMVKGEDLAPAGSDLSFRIVEPGVSHTSQRPDVIMPDDESELVFKYGDGTGAGLKYQEDYRLVYLGFGLEAVDATTNERPDEFSRKRTEVMRRMLDWLGIVDHSPLSSIPSTAQPINVQAKVSVADAEVNQVTLKWRVEGSEEFHSVPMQKLRANVYLGKIPAPNCICTVEYYVSMNTAYYRWTSPVGAPALLHRTEVGVDVQGPTIVHTQRLGYLQGRSIVPIQFQVTDKSGVDLNQLILHYSTETISDSLLLTKIGESDVFEGRVSSTLQFGDTLRYFVTALDLAQPPNQTVTETFSLIIGYEDFESGLDFWTGDSGGWGLDSTQALSGKFSCNDSPSSAYQNDQENTVTSAVLNFADVTTANLEFWTKYELEANKDFGIVEASADSGNSWNEIHSAFTGVQNEWGVVEISLDSYAGANHFLIRFRTVTDGSQTSAMTGWFIDDVRVIENTPTQVKTSENAVQSRGLQQVQNFPNPFNTQTKIHYQVSRSGYATLEVYDLLGRRVKTLTKGFHNSGGYDIVWDGRNSSHRESASGIYVVQLKSLYEVYRTKVLLVR